MSIEWSLDEITAGDKSAQEFLIAWGNYLRSVDNVVDDGLWDNGWIWRTFDFGVEAFSTPFYLRNSLRLQMLVLIGTGLWEISVEWERQEELWRREWADVLRHSDILTISGVIMLTAGWDKAQLFTRFWLIGGYHDHKRRYGLPRDVQLSTPKEKDPGPPIQESTGGTEFWDTFDGWIAEVKAFLAMKQKSRQWFIRLCIRLNTVLGRAEYVRGNLKDEVLARMFEAEKLAKTLGKE